MKLSPLVLLLAGALIGALAWGRCNGARADAAMQQLEAALHGQADSAAHWAMARESLTARLGALKNDSARLGASYARAQALARLGAESIAVLLRRLPDSTQQPLARAIQTLTNEGLACRETLGNCELRAANAEARVRGDSTQLLRLTTLTDTLEAAWHSAEQRARPSFFRDLWRSRQVTIPLIVVTIVSLVTHH